MDNTSTLNNLKNCPHCGKELLENSKFCQYCGTRIERAQGHSEQGKNATAVDEPCNKGISVVDTAEENKKKKGKAITYALGALVVALLGCSIFLFVSKNDISKKYSDISNKYSYVAEQLDIANQTITKQNETIAQNNRDISAVKKTRDQYKRERDAFQVTSSYYTTVQKWVKEHGTEYNKNTKYRTWTNIIAVKAGDTVNLDVYYQGNRWVWKSATNASCCSVEWSKKWSGNTTKLIITGKKAGISEIIFYLGDSNKADEKESFRVLVIVT